MSILILNILLNSNTAFFPIYYRVHLRPSKSVILQIFIIALNICKSQNCNPVFFLYYRICSTDSGFWATEFGISLFSSTDSGFWNTNHDFLIRSFVTMVENWYLIINFLPWSRNFSLKNHDLYFKTLESEKRYPKFCTPEARMCILQIL